MSIPTITREQQTVVILDAGIREPIPNLIYQYDFHDGDNDASTGNVHGSIVASRVLAADPNTNIVLFKVSPNNSDNVSSLAVTAALNWVVRYAKQLNVAAVNLSFSDGQVVSQPTNSIYSPIFTKLVDLDVAITVSAGNEGSKTGVSTFASSESVIAVSASDGRQSFTSISNRDADMTDLVAPGQNILFGSNNYSGTSLSAPFVAGAISAVKQGFFDTYGREATVPEVMLVLQNTGKPMRLTGEVAGTTANAGQGYVEVDLARALEAIARPDMLSSFGLGQEAYSFYAWSDDTTGIESQAYRLYQAAFNRKPDLPGLGFWVDTLEQGFSLTSVADYFVQSQEFQQTYGPNIEDSRFIELLYNNVLKRVPETDGFNFWIESAELGVTRAEMLAYFSESPENQNNVLPDISRGIQYLPFVT